MDCVRHLEVLYLMSHLGCILGRYSIKINMFAFKTLIHSKWTKKVMRHGDWIFKKNSIYIIKKVKKSILN